MVVGSLLDDIKHFGTGDSEVFSVVLLIIVVISVILVTVDVLRGHVVVAGILVVM